MNPELELLELAAKAAGISYDAEASKPHPVSGVFFGLWLKFDREPSEYDRRRWNPLRDDGDALRLAVKLRSSVAFWEEDVSALLGQINMEFPEAYGACPYAATRRSIVRAAAELGRKQGGTPA